MKENNKKAVIKKCMLVSSKYTPDKMDTSSFFVTLKHQFDNNDIITKYLKKRFPNFKQKKQSISEWGEPFTYWDTSISIRYLDNDVEEYTVANKTFSSLLDLFDHFPHLRARSYGRTVNWQRIARSMYHKHYGLTDHSSKNITIGIVKFDILSRINSPAVSNEDLESLIGHFLQNLYDQAVLNTKEACKEAIKPFIYQHIVIQELRDLYLSKIDGA